ncbi:unnamed protein product [Pleuronectes platessa]|uniref:Uncharacterized protein n=1 Tax=Pleuronectes platessa TaxID=8262 RepID=A0A9N7YCX5_PLEPL|nr:unnamed protein product [Pleuronectes platessa]
MSTELQMETLHPSEGTGPSSAVRSANIANTHGSAKGTTDRLESMETDVQTDRQTSRQTDRHAEAQLLMGSERATESTRTEPSGLSLAKQMEQVLHHVHAC